MSKKSSSKNSKGKRINVTPRGINLEDLPGDATVVDLYHIDGDHIRWYGFYVDPFSDTNEGEKDDLDDSDGDEYDVVEEISMGSRKAVNTPNLGSLSISDENGDAVGSYAFEKRPISLDSLEDGTYFNDKYLYYNGDVRWGGMTLDKYAPTFNEEEDCFGIVGSAGTLPLSGEISLAEFSKNYAEGNLVQRGDDGSMERIDNIGEYIDSKTNKPQKVES